MAKVPLVFLLLWAHPLSDGVSPGLLRQLLVCVRVCVHGQTDGGWMADGWKDGCMIEGWMDAGG